MKNYQSSWEKSLQCLAKISKVEIMTKCWQHSWNGNAGLIHRPSAYPEFETRLAKLSSALQWRHNFLSLLSSTCLRIGAEVDSATDNCRSLQPTSPSDICKKTGQGKKQQEHRFKRYCPTGHFYDNLKNSDNKNRSHRLKNHKPNIRHVTLLSFGTDISTTTVHQWYFSFGNNFNFYSVSVLGWQIRVSIQFQF